jgi:hypothetical protein
MTGGSDPSRPGDPARTGWAKPGEDELRYAVDSAMRDYFVGRRARIEGFVDSHFSLKGSAAIHRHALGWDLLKAPANILLAVPNVLARLSAAGLGAVGAEGSARYLGNRKILLDTAVGRELQWLVVTELLELPLEQEGRRSRKDALAEAILAAPLVHGAVQAALEAIGRRADDPAFRRELEATLTDYAGTRAAASEITAGLLALGAGALALKQATPGFVSLGPALAAVIAQQSAIASFPLGASLGSVWYGAFPVAASPALIAGMTGGLIATGALAAAFAGLLADPLQRSLGLHQRRLRRLVDALERHVREGQDGGFIVRDHYVARLLDLFDLLGAAYRLARV